MSNDNTVEFVLFFDLQTKSFYSYSEEKGILVKQKPPQFAQKLVRHQIIQHNILTEIQTWNSLNDFQKKPIPRYFLTQRKYKYPVYITQQPMPQALLQQKSSIDTSAHKNKSKDVFIDKISVNVNLRNIIGQVEANFQNSKEKKRSIPQCFSTDVKLLITANQLVRNVCRVILQDYETVITTKSGKNKLIFKINDKNQYIYGNQPLIKFQTIRNMIRNKKTEPLQLQLIQTDISNRQQFKRFIFFRHNVDTERGYFQPFPWKKLISEGMGQVANQRYPAQDRNAFLLWYRPSLANIDPTQLLNQRMQGSNKNPQIQKSYQDLKFKIQMMKKDFQEKVPRYIWKERIFDFLQERRQFIRQKLVDLSGSTIYTGECPFTWNFTITGVSNLKSIFRSQQSTNNDKQGQKSRNQPKIQYRPKSFLKFTGKQVLQGHYPKFMSSAFERNRRFTEIRKKGEFWITPYQISIQAQFYYNGQRIGQKNRVYETQPVIANQVYVQMNETFEWIILSKIMLETNLVFKLKVHSKEGAFLTGGIGVLKLFDQYGYLRQGQQNVQVLAIQNLNMNKLGCMDKTFQTKNLEITMIKVHMPVFRQPVRWSLQDQECLRMLGYLPEPKKKSDNVEIDEALQKISDILKVNPIRMLQYSSKEKQILRMARTYYSHQPDKLINYLIAIDWTDPSEIQQAYKVLEEWKALNPIQGLILMTRHISDEKIRLFAMKALEKMEEHDIILYANQISQALISFQTHDNPLIDWIIQKCCENPYQVAQEYFWQFRNKTSDPIICYRFRMYLETLVNTSPIRSNFYKQVLTNNILLRFNDALIEECRQFKYQNRKKHFKTKVAYLQSILRCKNDTLINKREWNPFTFANLNEQSKGNFTFPISCQNEYNVIKSEYCNVFDSKKMPFSLACFSCQPQNRSEAELLPQSAYYKIMFKEGDDIKQDHLILQLLKIFDNLWLEAGYNFQMNIYKVLSTGDQVGFIQLVEDSVNISTVHETSKNFIGALDKEVTLEYLKKAAENQKKKGDCLNQMKENFRKSCAGYLVATYILGIADRHSGNIMMQTNTGKIFHIDFGHILGNFKEKAGVKRQRTPFIFTVEHAHVMGGVDDPLFEQFEKDCADAFNILRRNGNLIIFLMMMLTTADLPQLRSYNDIEYLIDKLSLDLSQSHAAEKIIKQIRITLENQSQRVNNIFHQWRRKN